MHRGSASRAQKEIIVIDAKATAQTKSRYNRIVRIYDLTEALSERTFKLWREKLWSNASGNILEVGVGTGKNFPTIRTARR